MAGKTQPTPQPTPQPALPPKAPTQPRSNAHATMEKWIWILIYAGMFAVVLGIATGRVDSMLGWLIAVPGVVLTAVGIVLIYVRSRVK